LDLIWLFYKLLIVVKLIIQFSDWFQIIFQPSGFDKSLMLYFLSQSTVLEY